MWLVKSLVGDRPSWHKEPINLLNKMLSIRKVRLLITSRYIAMQSCECVIISKMFLIYFISYGYNGGALVFLGGAEASASPSFALPMFITIKKKIILHLFSHPGTPVATPLLSTYQMSGGRRLLSEIERSPHSHRVLSSDKLHLAK